MRTELLERVQKDYPKFKFLEGARFSFRPPKTIVVGPSEPDDELMLMHELGHAISGHRFFYTNVKRLKMEREAWEAARGLCDKYAVVYDAEIVERELDTYRDWVDVKSRCPRCGLARFQTPDGEFHCPRCENFVR